jgi:hypothetical protein
MIAAINIANASSQKRKKAFILRKTETLICAPWFKVYANAKNDVQAIIYPANSVPPGNTTLDHLVVICPTIRTKIITKKPAAITPDI